MSKKKLIKRCKSGDTVEKSDNTRVQMPRTDIEPIYYEPAALVERAIRKLPQAGSLTPVYPEFELLMGLRGLTTSFRPKKKLLTRHFKDPYGREVAPSKVKITVDNLADVTDEMWDEAYNAAIADYDLDEVQRLRDLHFKSKAPNTKVVKADGTPMHSYHGTKNYFTEFKPSKDGTYGPGIYSSTNKKEALGYVAYKPDLKDVTNKHSIEDLYFNLENPNDYRNTDMYDFMQLRRSKDPNMFNGDGVLGLPSWKGNLNLIEVVAHSPKQVKSATPITYDDLGNIIPLSKRDNFLNPDIRYSWLLPIGLTTTFGFPYLVNLNDLK